MNTKLFAMAAMGLCTLALPASAQIIATSIPREETAGTGKGVTGVEKKFAFHVMGSPLAKWNYSELYLDPNDVFGTIHGTPNSNFLFAGEAVFAAGTDFSIGVGGWYNKIGGHQFDFAGYSVVPEPEAPAGSLNINAVLDTDIKAYEGHIGLFYKDVGIQGGVVKSSGSVGPNGQITAVNGRSLSAPFTLHSPDANTTDLDLFGVYKHAFGGKGGSPVRAGLALGAGIYRKRGISSGSPLRRPDDNTVFSGFATLNLDFYKGLGIDVSYWYVGGTGTFNPGSGFSSFAGDSQSRFTVGLGYTFSR
jgi:hypothetical protein